MKKKFILLVALFSLMFSFAACGNEKTAEKEVETTETEVATTETEEETAEGTEAVGDWKPEENIMAIVAYKAGSGTDTTARLLTEYATEYLGQTMVIENLEGGSGSIGWTRLADSEPDGYTIGYVNLPTIASNIVEGLADYSMDDFIPIANHVTETSLIIVAADSEFNTLDELVEYAKANPGKLKASTNGNKASNHIGAQLFAKSADFEYSAIPYGGTADQMLALRQGEVDFTSAKEADIASMMSEVKILGAFSEERLESLPDVPTLGELGYYDKWYGSARAITAPAGTPENVIAFYEEAFKNAMANPEYLETAKNAGATTDYRNREETQALFDQQYKFVSEEVTTIWD